MKHNRPLWLSLLLLTLPVLLAPMTAAQGTADLPFGLELTAFSIPGLPGLHSFAAAGQPNALVLVAGRTNGLHGFSPSREAAQFPSFPREYANDTLYVVDLTAGKLLGQAKVNGLPSPYSSQLQASNVQYFLANGFFYIVGGYGPDPQKGSLVTLPFVTVIDMQALLDQVRAGKPLDEAFAKANMANFQHPALAITGGDILPQGENVLLIYGHQFDGEYVEGGGPAFQEYSNSVRVFTMATTRSGGGLKLTVTFRGSVPQIVGGMDPENPFHRRDLTVKPALDPAGNPRIGVYGGVFKGGRMEGYLQPIYITPAPSASLGISAAQDDQAQQLLSQYDCAALQSWSKKQGAMYSTFFGGISQLYWDSSCSCLRRDPVGQKIDGLPFISSISTFRVNTAGSAHFLHLNSSFPPAGQAPTCQAKTGPVTAQFLGAETKLIPTSTIDWSNGVLQLDSLKTKTTVAYLIGGIAAWCPPGGANSLRCYASTQGQSCAANQVYRLTLDPSVTTSLVQLKAP